tara:strand:- start:2506 stop:3564 length:1059 start_codon:yes stop_codon:yes gene_type:complete
MVSSTGSGDFDDVKDGAGAGDHFVILDGHDVVLTGATALGSIAINGNGTLDGNGQTLTLNDGGQANIFSSVGTGADTSAIKGILDVDITGTTARGINEAGTGGIRNLTITGNAIFTLQYHLTLTGTLTVTASSTLDTGADKNLTVTSDLDITGTLNGNASTIACNSLTVNTNGTYNATSGITYIESLTTSESPQSMHTTAGTMNHNDGKVWYRGKGANNLRWGEGHVYDLHVECDGSSGSAIILEGDAGAGHVEVMNDLTLTNQSGNGLLCRMNGTNYDLTVHGDMYLKRGDSSTSSESIYFYYNGDSTANWDIKGKLHLSGNEHVRFRAPNASGRLRVGSFINEGAYFQST